MEISSFIVYIDKSTILKRLILQNHLTVICSFNFSNVFSPNPLISIRSSIVLNEPFVSRYSIMANAFEGPIPGNVCKSDSVAVLKLIFPSCSCTFWREPTVAYTSHRCDFVPLSLGYKEPFHQQLSWQNLYCFYQHFLADHLPFLSYQSLALPDAS